GVAPEQHLQLAVNDVADPAFGEVPPGAHHIERLLSFGRDWSGDAPMLVHCWAGISRSTAAAYILLCDRFGAGCESEVAKALRFRAPHAFPNALMVRLADEALDRQGRMIGAVEALGRGRIVAEGECVELPLERKAL
ncbi:MAG: tyrosine protein phosphatase, partial [Pseudomonadota bacterium]|nr:tyrosine protein phosphatase [Pseudomonadota bacterium]